MLFGTPSRGRVFRRVQITGSSSMSQQDRKDGNGGETPDSAAHYIASMAGELALIARRNSLDTLGYILEMARIEADQYVQD